MKSFFLKNSLNLILVCFLFVSCESEYARVVKKEMKSGVIHEDLIFNMKMGQTRKEFYGRCWELNNKQLISQGPGNNYAKYIMQLDSTSEDSQNINMLFYGIFDEDKIMHGMDMKLSYVSWAPWNEAFHSDKLAEALQKKYMTEYGGNPFIEITIKDKKKAFVKVDGNRQILIYALNDKDVSVKIEDLRQKNK